MKRAELQEVSGVWGDSLLDPWEAQLQVVDESPQVTRNPLSAHRTQRPSSVSSEMGVEFVKQHESSIP